MDEYMSEKEQVEALRRWWDENARFVIAGLAVGVLGVFGYNQWQSQLQVSAREASDTYLALVEAVEEGDLETAATMQEELVESYPRTAYPAQGALMMAKGQVEAGDLEAAQAPLRWAMEEGRDPALERLARLRLARVLLATGDDAGAEALVTEVEGGGYTALYDELLGDVYRARGEAAAARDAYQRALDALTQGVGDRETLEMKLRDVTRLEDEAVAVASDPEEPQEDAAVGDAG